VVITLGRSGALVSAGGRYLVIAALPVDVIDTTGAGDAFCGAFATELATGADPFEAARVGVVAGSLAVTRAGAQPSMPNRAEIAARLNS
jgi:ribokinase